jgi:hypothetical protein
VLLLGFNRIASMDDLELERFPNLRVLHLQSNQLTSLHVSLLVVSFSIIYSKKKTYFIFMNTFLYVQPVCVFKKNESMYMSNFLYVVGGDCG